MFNTITLNVLNLKTEIVRAIVMTFIMNGVLFSMVQFFFFVKDH